MGGNGSDLFVFDSFTGTEVDGMMDFTTAQGDKMVLNKSVFAGLTSNAGDALNSSEFAVVNSNNGLDQNAARIIYNSSTGRVFYNADGAGIGQATEFVFLNNYDAISADSFRIG